MSNEEKNNIIDSIAFHWSGYKYKKNLKKQLEAYDSYEEYVGAGDVMIMKSFNDEELKSYCMSLHRGSHRFIYLMARLDKGENVPDIIIQKEIELFNSRLEKLKQRAQAKKAIKK